MCQFLTKAILKNFQDRGYKLMRMLRLVVVLIFGLAQFTFAIPAFAKGSNHALKVIALVEQQQVFGGGGGGGGGSGCSSAGGITAQAECGGGGGGSSCPVDLDYDGKCDFVDNSFNESFGGFSHSEYTTAWVGEWSLCSNPSSYDNPATQQGPHCAMSWSASNTKTFTFGGSFEGSYGFNKSIEGIVGLNASGSWSFTLSNGIPLRVNLGYKGRYVAYRQDNWYSGTYKRYYYDYDTWRTGSKVEGTWWVKKPAGVASGTNLEKI
jgi:hypothetical protein